MKSLTNSKSIIIFLSLFLLVPAIALTQDEPTDDRPEEIKKIINDNQERFVFELTHDRFDTAEDVDVRPFSRGFNVYYMKNIPLGDSKMSVAPGLGIANRNVHMDNVYIFDIATTDVSLPRTPAELDRTLSKISTTYAEIPVELRYSSTPDKRGHSFKVAAGFRAGYVLASKFKYKGQVFEGSRFIDDSSTDLIFNEKYKTKKLENYTNFRIAPSFRIGYGSVNLFGLYHVNQEFESGKGPVLNGYSIGVSISSF